MDHIESNCTCRGKNTGCPHGSRLGLEINSYMDLHKEWILQEKAVNEEEIIHREQSQEIAFYEAVSSGDLDAVRQNCAQRRFLDLNGVGILSRNPLTNMKYHFVVGTALITRFCVNAGMEMELAYRLSDFYIQKLDSLDTIEEVFLLHERMLLDFTGKMRLMRNGLTTSKPINECIQYIYAHIKERITVDTLAEHIGLSTNYISRLFKEKTGISVSDFIREKKIEKAQNLLKYSDYSSIEIANYLSFSSQSHFIQLFKKYTGMSPKKYHDMHHDTIWGKESMKQHGSSDS